MDTIAHRILALAATEDEPRRLAKLRAAWVIVSLHVAIRLTLSIWFAGSRLWLPLPAALFTLGCWRRFARPAAIVFAAIQGVRFVLAYPDVSNHYLVECLAVLIFAACDPFRDGEAGDERELCLSLLGWLIALVLFLSGLQKLLHGCWFHGQFLALMVATTDRFRDFFAPLLSPEDLAHLRALGPALAHLHVDGGQLVGAPPGPFRVDSLLFVAISNAVWLGELALPIGLLWKRTRPFALVGALLLLLGIVASSHEVFFDTLFVNLLLLFARSELIRKLLPLSLAAYAFYLLGGLGVVHVGFVW